jgi:NAD(P)H dehydrogenase (quinone)
VFSTSNTPPDRELAVFGDPLETLWKNCIFGLCGVPLVYRKNFAVVVTSTDAQRQAWLEEVKEIVGLFCPT